MHEYIQTSMNGWEGWVHERLGSNGKGPDHQTRRPESNPWDPMWMERNNSKSCPLTSA